MTDKPFFILRLGMAISFVWIGVYILQMPEAWGNYLQPWAKALVPIPIKWLMLATGILDITIGVLFVLNKFIRYAALAASLHLVVILITSGINAITVRDIGLIGTALFLYFYRRQ